MTFDSYVSVIMPAYFAAHPMERGGQAYFNCLNQYAPHITDKIRGTECDPFYDNARLPKFFQEVIKLMEA